MDDFISNNEIIDHFWDSVAAVIATVYSNQQVGRYFLYFSIYVCGPFTFLFTVNEKYSSIHYRHLQEGGPFHQYLN
jgi:hypothetical protein